jgi:hypothetical protein
MRRDTRKRKFKFCIMNISVTKLIFRRTCHVCGHEFLSSISLENHIASKHTKIPTHNCEECGAGNV